MRHCPFSLVPVAANLKAASIKVCPCKTMLRLSICSVHLKKYLQWKSPIKDYVWCCNFVPGVAEEGVGNLSRGVTGDTPAEICSLSPLFFQPFLARAVSCCDSWFQNYLLWIIAHRDLYYFRCVGQQWCCSDVRGNLLAGNRATSDNSAVRLGAETCLMSRCFTLGQHYVPCDFNCWL